jgi:hypothetical protein
MLPLIRTDGHKLENNMGKEKLWNISSLKQKFYRTSISPQDTVWLKSVLVIWSSRCSEFLSFMEIGAVKGNVSVGNQTKFLTPAYTNFG